MTETPLDSAPGIAGVEAPPRAGGEVMFQPPGWHWTQAGEIGWWVRPAWRETLIGPQGLRLDEWRKLGKLTTIKTGPHRTVYRADLSEGAVYVKHYRVPGVRTKLRQWVRRGKGRNEGKRAIELAQIGVTTITPIALGEQRKRKFLFENYLITHAITDTMPLDKFVEERMPQWTEARQARVRQYLAEAMAELTARLHEAGFVHNDFHPGNLLVRMEPGDRPRLAMIDLDALRVLKTITWSDARANLALLNHYFWLRCGRVDRYRFLRAYLAARQQEPPDARAFARGIEEATRSWAERLWRRWGRRCRGGNKYFKAYRGRGSWAAAARTLDPAFVRTLMKDPDAPFGFADARLLKHSRTTTVAELCIPVLGRQTRVIYKRFNRKKWFEPLLCFFRPSRAWRSWQAAQHLSSRGIATPANLAIIGRAWLGKGRFLSSIMPRETYLITAKAEPATTLRDYLFQTLPQLPASERRSQIQRLNVALAWLIRTLHERSLSDRDLKASNILVEGNPAVSNPRLSLIDLVGVQLAHPIPQGRRIQNLARLQVSLAHVPGRTRTDSLRFLRAYTPAAFARRDTWKALWRSIAARCADKEERNRRTGRIIS
jgi:tRNA A-37 threonylcarbamoyl transferase component Bud32